MEADGAGDAGAARPGFAEARIVPHATGLDTRGFQHLRQPYPTPVQLDVPEAASEAARVCLTASPETRVQSCTHRLEKTKALLFYPLANMCFSKF